MTDGAVAVLTRSEPTKAEPTTDSTGGDPRALVPYLIAAAAVALGVLYDIRPV